MHSLMHSPMHRASMNRFMLTVFAVIAGLIAWAAPASAQRRTSSALDTPTWAVDGSIGLAAPVGDFGTGLSAGADLMGAVEAWFPRTAPIGFRAEIGYSHFGASNSVNASANIVRFLVDALYDFHLSGTAFEPYILGGLGIYHVSFSVDECAILAVPGCVSGDASTGLGINFGGGVRYPFGPVQGFAEVRYQLPFTAPGGLSDAPYFPLQLGVRYVLPK